MTQCKHSFGRTDGCGDRYCQKCGEQEIKDMTLEMTIEDKINYLKYNDIKVAIKPMFRSINGDDEPVNTIEIDFIRLRDVFDYIDDKFRIKEADYKGVINLLAAENKCLERLFIKYGRRERG